MDQITWAEIIGFVESIAPKIQTGGLCHMAPERRGIRGRRKRIVAQIKRQMGISFAEANRIVARGGSTE